MNEKESYKEFYDILKKKGLITDIWVYILELIAEQVDKTADGFESCMKLITIYFSLIDDGNTCMSLDSVDLSKKWNARLDSAKVYANREDDERQDENDSDWKQIKEASGNVIKEEILSLLSSSGSLGNVIGDKDTDGGSEKLLCVADGWLYLSKYYQASKGISESVKKLFSSPRSMSGHESNVGIPLEEMLKEGRQLTDEQKEAVNRGIRSNLIITGGPGTGKTTSILFILLNLLCKLSDKLSEMPKIYLVAFSGKAKSRMKESIDRGFSEGGWLKPEFIEEHQKACNAIKASEPYTIHSFLGQFIYNNPFEKDRSRKIEPDAIVVIDEASMIDLCIFDALLNRIPDTCRVFIMGDKNQLPAVEKGDVFAKLLEMESLKDFKVELDTSVRFGKDTEIYKLADRVNRGEEINDVLWEPYSVFKVREDPKPNDKPVYYVLDQDETEEATNKKMVESIVEKWGEVYYKGLADKVLGEQSTGLSSNVQNGELSNLFRLTEKGKILCAENRGSRGIDAINTFLKNKYAKPIPGSKPGSLAPGQLVMIVRNNKSLNLNNGDSGLIVSFENDDSLYFMTKCSAPPTNSSEKKDGKVFSIGDYTFFPTKMIADSDITSAYAITIHKSQGSDYDNILVILPKQEGHPLMNRQIVYTAITRTKGNTYLFSNKEALNAASKRRSVRDTNIGIS